MTIGLNDTVTWINHDTEAHTATSGFGGGMESLVNVNKKGSPKGDFNSGLFKPGQSWIHTFTNPGVYNYFCTIHPWMEGIINVKAQAQNIPNYPVTDTGKRIDKFLVYTFTPDGKLEVGSGTANEFRKMLDLSEVTWICSRVSQPTVGTV